MSFGSCLRAVPSRVLSSNSYNNDELRWFAKNVNIEKVEHYLVLLKSKTHFSANIFQ